MTFCRHRLVWRGVHDGGVVAGSPRGGRYVADSRSRRGHKVYLNFGCLDDY